MRTKFPSTWPRAMISIFLNWKPLIISLLILSPLWILFIPFLFFLFSCFYFPFFLLVVGALGYSLCILSLHPIYFRSLTQQQHDKDYKLHMQEDATEEGAYMQQNLKHTCLFVHDVLPTIRKLPPTRCSHQGAYLLKVKRHLGWIRVHESKFHKKKRGGTFIVMECITQLVANN